MRYAFALKAESRYWKVVSRPPCPSPSPKVCPSSCPLNQWCHPTISSSVAHFSFCLQSFPASGFFQWVSFSHQVAKVLEFQILYQTLKWIFRVDFLYHWLVCLLAIQGTVKSLQHHSSKHQFFSTQPSLWSNSHTCTWILERP